MPRARSGQELSPGDVSEWHHKNKAIKNQTEFCVGVSDGSDHKFKLLWTKSVSKSWVFLTGLDLIELWGIPGVIECIFSFMCLVAAPAPGGNCLAALHLLHPHRSAPELPSLRAAWVWVHHLPVGWFSSRSAWTVNQSTNWEQSNVKDVTFLHACFSLKLVYRLPSSSSFTWRV